LFPCEFGQFFVDDLLESRTQRTVAPLKPADDAVLIDTTGIGIEDVVARVMDLLPVPAA